MSDSVKEDDSTKQNSGRIETPKPLKPRFEAIVTDSSWLMLNGLVDVNRDVLVKLVKIMDDSEKTRNIIGMTMLFYIWSKHRMFRLARMAWKEGCAFRIKCKDNTYGYGKCNEDIVEVCNEGDDNVMVYLSLSKTTENTKPMKKVKKADVTKFEFVTYSATKIDKNFLRKFTSLVIPPIIPNSVTYIDSYFMSYCSSLATPPSIPNSVTFIGGNFMSFCLSLTTPPSIPNTVTHIQDCFMSLCSSLTTPPTIPNTVTNIGRWFMSGCWLLTTPPTIPNSVTHIGACFMSNCKSLATPPLIPNSVTFIDNDFMSGCTSLIKPPTIPNSVTHIGACFMSNCKSLATPPLIPNSVTFIGRKLHV